MDKVKHAELISIAAHYGQVDNGGRPRKDHVHHVACCFQDETHRIVAYLHDVLEDSPLIFAMGIGEVFGKEVMDAVVAITRNQGEQYFDYIKRCNENPIARAVKIEDINHNMQKWRWPEMPDSYEKREIKALAILENEDTNSLPKE